MLRTMHSEQYPFDNERFACALAVFCGIAVCCGPLFDEHLTRKLFNLTHTTTMKVSKLMLGLAFVACAGLLMTSCKKKKKGEGLTKDEAQTELIAAQEALVALDVEVSEMPAIKILDYMMVSHGGLKVAEFDHLTMDYFHKAYFFWKDYENDFKFEYEGKTYTNGIYIMEESGQFNKDVFHPWDGTYGISFAYGESKDTTLVSWENIAHPDTMNGLIAGSLSVKQPYTFTTYKGTPLLSTVYCGVVDNDRYNGNINFTLSGNEKIMEFLSNNGATAGVNVPVANMVVGNGSYVHTFEILKGKDIAYKLWKAHGQAAGGLVGYDKDEFDLGSFRLEMTTKTILSSSSDITLYRVGSTKDKICSMAADGTITYNDGTSSSLANVAPKLWNHLKAIFPEKLK